MSNNFKEISIIEVCKTFLFSVLVIYLYMLVTLERIHLLVFHKCLYELEVVFPHKFENYCSNYSFIIENKKTWEALNVYFSNKLQFERKLYYYRPGKPNWELLVWDISSFDWNKKSHWLYVSVSKVLRDFDFFDHIYLKRVLPVENRKPEHHHGILHI